MSRNLIVVVLVSVLAACDGLAPAPPPPQEVIVRVTSDPGKPLMDVQILHTGKPIASTNSEGVGKLKLDGNDGVSFDFFVKCPKDFQSPTNPLQVVLRRFAGPAPRPEYAVTCPPIVRTVVVAIRAEGGANLPVMHLGREVARTDSSGAAHVLLKVIPEEPFSLVLDTSASGMERLRPQNPTMSFTAKNRDDVLIFDKKFDEVAKVIPRARVRRGPQRIGD